MIGRLKKWKVNLMMSDDNEFENLDDYSIEKLSEEIEKENNKQADSEETLNELRTSIEEDDKEIAKAVRALEKLKEERKGKADLVQKTRLSSKQSEKRANALNQRKNQFEAAKQAQRLSEEKLDEFSTRRKKFAWNDYIFKSQYEDAARIAYTNKIIVGNEMGTGKTITGLAAADLAKIRNLLIITPANISSNFYNEVVKWAGHRQIVNLAGHTNGIKSNVLDIVKGLHERKEPTCIVINYEAWRRDKGVIDKLIECQFQGLILDEAHSFKNKSTDVFYGVKKIANAINRCPRCKTSTLSDNSTYGLMCSECGWSTNTASDEEFQQSRSIRMIVPMTGTALMNKPNDLWPLLNLIQPKTFDKERTFLEVFAQQNPYTGYWTFTSGGANRLSKRLGSCYIKRTMSDMGIILPKQRETIVEVPLEEKHDLQRKIIKQLAQSAAIMLDDDKRVGIQVVIDLITKQRQANVWASDIKIKDPESGEIIWQVGDKCDQSAKLDYLENAIAEDVMFNDKRIAVFSQFKKPYDELERRLKALGINVVRYDGDTSNEVAEEVRQDFDRNYPDKGKYSVVLANYKKGGVGLNFTDITKAYQLDDAWNPATKEQAQARLCRIGQTEETEYVILRTPGTIDTWMKKLNEQKNSMIEGFNNAQANESLAEVFKESLKEQIEEL